MSAEFRESEKDLATTYVMLENEILKVKEEISKVKSIHDVTQAVLKENARITTELSNISSANNNFRTFNQLKTVAKEYVETRDEVIAEQLSDINFCINDEMKIITTNMVKDATMISPKLKLEKLNSYSFETKGDGGSGAALRGLITFDLANMHVLNIPFIVHDADLMDPIEKPTLTEIIEMYDSVKDSDHQAFVSFRSYEFYADEIRPLLEKCKVIQLEARGNELFGWAWNKEVVIDEKKGE